MKKLSTLVFLLLGIVASFAQVPEKINYQAVVRDNVGELISNQSIEARISVIDNTADGTVLFSETHTLTTSDKGLMNIVLGDGTVVQGTFTSIDWTTNIKFLQIEINTGSGFVDLGTVQLLSVPYALFAKDVENKDDADASVTNEIQDISLTGTDLSISSGSTVDLSVLQDGTTDADSDPTNEFQSINLDGDTLSISDGNRIVFPYDSSRWSVSGDKLYYSTGNVGIGSSNPVSNLEVKANAVGTEALFQVINANNDTVFAVYPDGVKVFVDSDAKGKVGGFAVSGRNPAKSGDIDILRVTPDSTVIYVNDTLNSKGKTGGFAVSGRNPSKGLAKNYLGVYPDSTRITFNKTAKGKVGGFAVSGRNPAKGSTNSLLNLFEDNYFIGHESGAITTGTNNLFLGYETGMLSEKGDNNVMIGSWAGYMNNGNYNVFLGYESGYNNIGGADSRYSHYNTFVGYQSGKGNTTGWNNVYIGYKSGLSSSSSTNNVLIGNESGALLSNGSNNVFIGSLAGWNSDTCNNNVFIGNAAGMNNTDGYNNLYIGEGTGAKNTDKVSNVFLGNKAGGYYDNGNNNVMIGDGAGYYASGKENILIGSSAGTYADSGNVMIGYRAGAGQNVSNKLYIDNSSDATPLIYGDFLTDEVTINGTLYATTYGPSDLKLKTDLVALTSSLKLLSGITAYYFKWNDYAKNELGLSDHTQLGVLAQDVEKVCPEIVSTNSKGYKAVDYSKLTPLLLEAIKEQQSNIEDLENKNIELQKRLEAIEKKLELLSK